MLILSPCVVFYSHGKPNTSQNVSIRLFPSPPSLNHLLVYTVITCEYCDAKIADLFKVPFGGWAMSLAGDLAIHFTAEKGGWGVKKGSIGPMMEQAKTYVNSGIFITVFPEGARSPTGELQEFKDGMFKLATETGAAIVPVAVCGTNRAYVIPSATLCY
jgi:1-acyl-sn-glycerol-3-phosphate acyltransferase